MSLKKVVLKFINLVMFALSPMKLSFEYQTDEVQ